MFLASILCCIHPYNNWIISICECNIFCNATDFEVKY